MVVFIFKFLTFIFVLQQRKETTSEAAQILGLFAHPGKSHFDFFRPIFLGLASRGHNVSMYSYFPNKAPVANYTDFVFEGMPLLTDFIDLSTFESASSSNALPFKIPTFFMLHDWGLRSCDVALNSPLIANLLSSSIRFDVIILEYFANDCMSAVAHLLNTPVISLSSCAIMPWHYKRMGSPFVNSIMPMNFLPYTDEMDFVARLNNFFHFHTVDILYRLLTQTATDKLIAKRFGSGQPSINDIVQNTSLMLINQHYSLTGVRPYSSNVVEVGGLQIKEEKPLPAELQRVFNRKHLGVIYISWGSMINPLTLPEHKRQELFHCITAMSDYSFVMRWPSNITLNKPHNLYTFDWLPQGDLLCHRQVKAFMTHGGLLGTTEAVHCGVPMLVTPFYGDQFLNAAAIQQRKFGVILHFESFDRANLKKSLEIILSSDFAAQVKSASVAFRERPQSPLELSLWWIEHVIQTRGAPLAHNVARNINWFIYNSFDIYLFIIGIGCFTLYGICRLLRLLYQFLIKRKPKNTSEKIKHE